MFVTDKLVYIQMQKTGSSHIVALLSGLFEGEQIGNHNAATAEQLNAGTFFISSIRNPWDWYLSLWTFGVQGGGGLRQVLTNREYRKAIALLPRHPVWALDALRREMRKDIALWRGVYDDDTNVDSFRQWLRQIHDPENAAWLGEGYGDTAVTGFCGFMTYRYLSLCCADTWKLKDRRCVSSVADLQEFDRESCYIDYVIRQEFLEEDFIEAVERVRPLDVAARERILGARKTNTSRRSLTVADYYDDRSVDLVATRDRLLIDKFRYEPPGRASRTGNG